MKDYSLTSFIEIDGFGAASGLLFEQGKLKIISDDSEVLYIYDLIEETLSKVSLREDGELIELQEKSLKPDYESITRLGKEILIFGSGSSPNRNIFAKLRDDKPETVEIISLIDLYKQIKTTLDIADEDFNIEGVIASEEQLLLFNRGNGPNAQNGVVKVLHWKEGEAIQVSFLPIALPIINEVPFGFTDAIQIEDKIYFLAAAEAGGSTYHDGEVLGSIIGRLDAITFELIDTQQISNEHKFEGIVLFEKVENEISFLLCEDPDDGGSSTEIFKLDIRL